MTGGDNWKWRLMGRSVITKVRKCFARGFSHTFRKCLSLRKTRNILVLLITIMNHTFCLISAKYVINPALIHITYYITKDRTLKK